MNKHKVIYLFALICVLFSSLFAYADAGEETPQEFVLSLNTVVLFALQESPDVKMAKEREVQNEYFTDEASSSFYPQINLSANGGRQYNNPVSGKNTNNTSVTTLSVQQNLFDGFKTTEKVREREAMEDSAFRDTEIKKEKVISDATRYYLQLMRYQREEKEAKLFVEEINKVVGIVDDMYKAGATSKSMMDYALSRQASAHLRLNEARSSLKEARSNLEFLTGKLPDFTATDPDELSVENLDKEYYVNLISSNNNSVRKNKAEIEALEHKYESERSALFPSVSLKVKAERTYNDGGDIGPSENMSALLKLNYNIFDGFKNKSATARIKSQIKELDIKESKIIRELKKDVVRSYEQVLSIQEAITATDAEIKASIDLQALNFENFKLGSINVMELIEGEERLNDARTRRHKLVHDLFSSTYALLIKTGVLKDAHFCSTCVDEKEQ